ncbi:MAG: helix-turn-helix transcriptional regulator [Muribaculaceae bacterium]|nr:helix-turn-helix transcriptional regulator [Muribaculaceae bacterium]
MNRLKIVLAEHKKTNKWLADQLQKDPATVSKWCTNHPQPSLETLRDIANLLKIDIKGLINSTRITAPEVMYVKVKR